MFLFQSTVLFIKEYIQKQNYNFLPNYPRFKHFNFESKAIRKTSRQYFTMGCSKSYNQVIITLIFYKGNYLFYLSITVTSIYCKYILVLNKVRTLKSAKQFNSRSHLNRPFRTVTQTLFRLANIMKIQPKILFIIVKSEKARLKRKCDRTERYKYLT